MKQTSYGVLVKHYGNVIVDKLQFHNKYLNVPGSLNIKDSALQKMEAGDQFELAVDFLDRLENAIKMKKKILDSFDIGGRSHSLTSSGQCRLAALVPLTNDTSRLLDALTKLLRLLHLTLTWDMLSGHRDRFQKLYSELGALYDQLSHFQYLKSLMQIPRLSGDIEHYMNTLRQLALRNEMPPEQKFFADEDLNDAVAESNDLISVADDSVDAASMAYIQQEYSDLSSRYQMVLQMLESEQQARQQEVKDHMTREQQLKDELSITKRDLVDFTASNKHGTSASAESDSKLEKLKTLYQKLRTDHITVLRQKGDSEKKVDELQKKLELKKNQDSVNMETLRTFLERNSCSWEGQNEDELKGALRHIEEKIACITATLEAKNQTIADLTAKSQLSVKADNDRIAELTKSIDLLKVEHQGLQTKCDNAISETEGVLHKWREHLKLEFDTLGTYLSNEASMSGGLPQLETLLCGIDRKDLEAFSEKNNDHFASQDRLVFQVLFTLVNLAPYCNTDAVKLAQLYRTGDSILKKLESEEPVSSEWQQFCDETSVQIQALQKANFNPSEDVDREIEGMQDAIKSAADAMEKLMTAARSNEAKKPNVDVDIKILDSCSGLITAIQAMIISARQLQNEITAESGAFAKEFYQKNQKWSEGLISAAKDIGGGAKFLVEAANNVVSKNGKFEEVMAASQEIAGGTAQMVLASRVKARKGSQKLDVLSASSKAVGDATAQVIATCRTCASQMADREQEVDIEALSVHETKKLEMEIQIKVLEYETALDQQRQKLFALRKLQYAKSQQHKDAQDDEIT